MSLCLINSMISRCGLPFSVRIVAKVFRREWKSATLPCEVR
jgi:hypothetical protein